MVTDDARDAARWRALRPHLEVVRHGSTDSQESFHLTFDMWLEHWRAITDAPPPTVEQLVDLIVPAPV